MLETTGYAEVDAILQRLLEAVREILQDRFVGLYLHGSLASGDFNPVSSDIDFIIVTTDDLPSETVEALRLMHEQLAASDAQWGAKLEGEYMPMRVLRHYDPEHADYPHLSVEAPLRVERHGRDAIQRYILREHGITLAGESIQLLLDPISEDILRAEVLSLLRGWWSPVLDDDSRLHQRGYQPYAVLTMCRMLYTLQTGRLISKPAAAHWALEALPEQWWQLIADALEAPERNRDASVPATADFIHYTIRQVNKNPD